MSANGLGDGNDAISGHDTSPRPAAKIFALRAGKFGKRKFRGRDQSPPPATQSDAGDGGRISASTDGDASHVVRLADLREVQKVRYRPRGLDADTLQLAGANTVDTEDSPGVSGNFAPDSQSLRAIGLSQNKSAGGTSAALGSGFTSTNKTLDAKKHMERFIEEEMSKLRGKKQEAGNDALAGDEKPHASAFSDPDSELFHVPDHLKLKTQEVKEENVTAAASMLTAVPEVHLGSASRMRAIEQVKKYREMEQQNTAALGAAGELLDRERDLAFNHNPYPSMRWRISRKTREVLYGVHSLDYISNESMQRGAIDMSALKADEEYYEADQFEKDNMYEIDDTDSEEDDDDKKKTFEAQNSVNVNKQVTKE